jgi:hypothetical protein
METLFQNRGYNVLELYNGSLETFLSSGFPRTVTFEFPQNQDQLRLPSLDISGSGTYFLYRSTGNGRFNPMPLNNRYFMNYPELTDPAYLNTNNNADVVDKSGASPRYAYAAFFIVAVGLNTATFSSIYSTPAFIGVLKLPDPS